MLLREYNITKVRCSFCNPEWIAVRAELSDDISEVFPYLNAVLKNAVYTPKVPSLNFKMETGFISLMPREINVGQVLYEDDAIKILDYLKELVNDTWEKRKGITPLYERKGEIKAKDIVDFLPKTNCRDCGLPTCFAFAVAMIRGQKRLKDCSALSKPEFAEDKEALVRLLQTVALEDVAKWRQDFLASKRAHREGHFKGINTGTVSMVIKTLHPLLLLCLALSLMLGCTASSTAPPAANGGELSTYQLEIDLLGTRHELLVDNQGGLKTNVAISSADGGISLSLKKGTMALDKEGKPLKVVSVSIDSSPPSPPEDAYIVEAVYYFRPEGANFNPQIQLTLSYGPGELPEGIGERDVYIACYQDTGWKKLLYKNVDTASHRVTTQIDYFAKYAALAPLPPGEHPTSDTSLGPADKVEVVYFHRAQRCSGCLYAEAGTRYTLETYFADELSSDKLTFRVLNVEDEGNAGIAEKYGAYTSSLFINTIKDGADHIAEVPEIWLLLGNDQEFIEMVRNKIERSLKGEV